MPCSIYPIFHMNNMKSSVAFFFLVAFPVFSQSQQHFSCFYFHYYLFVQAPLRMPLTDYGLSVSIVMLKWIMVINGVEERKQQVWHSSPTLPSLSKCSLQPHQHNTTPPHFTELARWTFSIHTAEVCRRQGFKENIILLYNNQQWN